MADQTLARYVNNLKILTLLRMQGHASRADIARQLSVTPATITRLISSLVDRGLVREIAPTGAVKSPSRELGRPAGSVGLNPEGGYFFGVEIAVGIIRFCLLDLAACVVDQSETKIVRSIEPTAAIDEIATQLHRLQQDRRYAGKIRSAGITVPGIVTADGFVVNLPIMGWKQVDLLGLLAKTIDIPCFVENDANAAAFGSTYTEPEMPRICTVFLKLDEGCGGAAIVDGRLLRGANGTAGEFGHIRISDQGRRCGCGQTGCLETYVGLTALAISYHGTEKLSESQYAALPHEVAAAAQRGDERGLAAVADFGCGLTRGIVTLVNIFNPTTIILGGPLLPVAALCVAAVSDGVTAGVVPGMVVPDIRLSRLGRQECAVGAATIAHHHTFDISYMDIFGDEGRDLRTRGSQG